MKLGDHPIFGTKSRELSYNQTVISLRLANVCSTKSTKELCMKPARSLIFSILIMVVSLAAVQAQRRWERLPPPRDPQFYVPRNKLEDVDGRMETLLIKGRHWVGTLRS